MLMLLPKFQHIHIYILQLKYTVYTQILNMDKKNVKRITHVNKDLSLRTTRHGLDVVYTEETEVAVLKLQYGT